MGTLLRMTSYDDVLEVAVGNHGYVTARDARAAGVDPTVLRKLVATGRLERTAQGVYRVPVLAGGAHAAYAEAVAWTRGRGVLSHESALDLLDLCDVNPPMIHLTVPSTYTPRRLGGDLYRVWRRTLDPATVITFDGLLVVRPRESIQDCLAYGTDAALLVQACETARREGYLTDDDLVGLERQVQFQRRYSPGGRLDVLSGPIGQRVRRRRRRLVDIAGLHGVRNLRVFGSVARGEDRPDSDLDLLVDLPPGLGLLGLGHLREDLEAIMGSPVDLVPASDLKPGLRVRVEAELIAL